VELDAQIPGGEFEKSGLEKRRERRSIEVAI
jgi:hypothetical protein